MVLLVISYFSTPVIDKKRETFWETKNFIFFEAK